VDRQDHRALVDQQAQVVQVLRGLVDLRVLAVLRGRQGLRDPRVLMLPALLVLVGQVAHQVHLDQ